MRAMSPVGARGGAIRIGSMKLHNVHWPQPQQPPDDKPMALSEEAAASICAEDIGRATLSKCRPSSKDAVAEVVARRRYPKPEKLLFLTNDTDYSVRSESDTEQAAERSEPIATIQSFGGNTHIVELIHPGLRITCWGIVEHVPLLFAEVAPVLDCRTGERFISAKLASKLVWILVVDEDMVQQALEVMGSMGAFRHDLRKDDKIVLDSIIKSGGFSTVYMATKRGLGNTDSSDRAQTFQKEDTLVVKADHRLNVVRMEAELTAAVQGHPNIIKLYGIMHGTTLKIIASHAALDPEECSPALALLLQYGEAGDAFDWARERLPSETAAKHIVKALLSALAFIHAKDIVHRDVKAVNVMVTADSRPLLADFGTAAWLSDTDAMAKRPGSPGYAAPEVIMSLEYGTKVDTFSVGVLLYFILGRIYPFWRACAQETLISTVRDKMSFDATCFNNLTDECKEFMWLLSCKCPRDRPTCKDALSSSWIGVKPLAVPSPSSAKPSLRRPSRSSSRRRPVTPTQDPKERSAQSMVSEATVNRPGEKLRSECAEAPLGPKTKDPPRTPRTPTALRPQLFTRCGDSAHSSAVGGSISYVQADKTKVPGTAVAIIPPSPRQGFRPSALFRTSRYKSSDVGSALPNIITSEIEDSTCGSVPLQGRAFSVPRRSNRPPALSSGLRPVAPPGRLCAMIGRRATKE